MPPELAHLLPAPVDGEGMGTIADYSHRVVCARRENLPEFTTHALAPMRWLVAFEWPFQKGTRCPACDSHFCYQSKYYLQGFRTYDRFITRCMSRSWVATEVVNDKKTLSFSNRSALPQRKHVRHFPEADFAFVNPHFHNSSITLRRAIVPTARPKASPFKVP